MKYYWFNKHCCVPECFNSSTEGEGCFKEYFDLPAEPQARSRWLKAILIEDGEDLKVCEDHFKVDNVWRDKNNRKKLKLNSVPSIKLPKHICVSCLCPKMESFSNREPDVQQRICDCDSPSTALQPIHQVTPSKRTRITWTAEEKRTLFRAIKKYGDVKVGNHNIRINWTNVVNHCRSNGCFGNEKELRSVWQYIRINAQKVYRNEIFGSKLERKVSRFLYGKPSKKNRIRSLPGCSSTNDISNRNMEGASTDEDDEFHEESHQMIQELPEDEEEAQEEHNGTIVEENGENEEIVLDDSRDEEIEEEIVDCEDEDESDEYYSISDVEEKFHIEIRPKPTEVISLISSDED